MLTIATLVLSRRPLDDAAVTNQNGRVRRLLLVGLGLSLLWIASAPCFPVAPDDLVTMSAVESVQLAGDPHLPSGSDQHWRAGQHAIAAVTESLWRSALVHAGLADTPSARTFHTGYAASSPDPPVRSTPHYLRHTPLLI